MASGTSFRRRATTSTTTPLGRLTLRAKSVSPNPLQLLPHRKVLEADSLCSVCFGSGRDFDFFGNTAKQDDRPVKQAPKAPSPPALVSQGRSFKDSPTRPSAEDLWKGQSLGCESLAVTSMLRREPQLSPPPTLPRQTPLPFPRPLDTLPRPLTSPYREPLQPLRGAERRWKSSRLRCSLLLPDRSLGRWRRSSESC